MGIFSQIDPGELQPLADKLRRRNFQKGEVIFHQDDPGDRLHFLAEGLVKISIVSRDGRENDIALLTQGDCFGEMSVLDGGSRSATAVAVDPTETMTLSREDFLDFLNQHGDVALQIIVLMVRRLRNMDEMVGDMVFLDVPTRVAKKLIELVNTYEASPVGARPRSPWGRTAFEVGGLQPRDGEQSAHHQPQDGTPDHLPQEDHHHRPDRTGEDGRDLGNDPFLKGPEALAKHSAG